MTRIPRIPLSALPKPARYAVAVVLALAALIPGFIVVDVGSHTCPAPAAEVTP